MGSEYSLRALFHGVPPLWPQPSLVCIQAIDEGEEMRAAKLVRCIPRSTPPIPLFVFPAGAGIHAMQGTGLRRYGVNDATGCFCCFCGKLSAIDLSVSAEILGHRWLGERNNSQLGGCYFAVLVRNSEDPEAATAGNSFAS